MISSYTSSKLKWLTLIATLTVVWIHSNAIAFLPNISRLTSFTAHFLMIRMTAWAVPCFFMVSGFLFTYSYQNSYRRFLGKKIKSLMLPYFCWALIGTVMTIPLTLTCNILQGKSLWSNSFVEKGNYTFFGCIDQIFGIVETGPIDNGPLWYVRVLLLLFLISPLFMLVYKSSKLPILEVIIALILIVFFKSAYKFGDFELRLWAIPYFIIGMAAAKIDFWEKRIPFWLCILCGTCYVLLAVYESMLHISILKPYWILSYPWKVYCAIIFWAGLYDVCSKQADRIVKYIPMTFFIYCLHQPVLGYFRSFSRFFFRGNETVLLLNCIFSFLLTLALCIFISKVFERICPKTYKFLIGGR